MAAPRNTRALKRLGSRVRELRRERGLSQETLAGDAGIHNNHLSALERGEANPSFLVLISLAKVLKVPPADLFRDGK
jgi:transcriptional regulator with XRE-family HTH domain